MSDATGRGESAREGEESRSKGTKQILTKCGLRRRSESVKQNEPFGRRRGEKREEGGKGSSQHPANP